MNRISKFALYWTAIFAAALMFALAVTPKAHAIQMSDDVVVVGPEQTYSEAQVWKVWCTDETHCTLAGKPIPLTALIKQMPIASWGWCRKQFCYGDNNLSDVIGLNPKYYTD